MCARFTQHHSPAQITERFEVKQVQFHSPPRYNIAPGQTIAVILNDHDQGRVLAGFRWGLIPSWSKDPKTSNPLINARAESLPVKPTFKRALERRRCLIPADGFFEWTGQVGQREPRYFRRRDQALFAFPGLWDEWKDSQNQPLRSCTLITVEPNSLVQSIHNRMPAMLDREGENLWLDTDTHDPGSLRGILKPYPAEAMEMLTVSRRMNSPQFDDPACIAPIPPELLLPI
jgi:putative SOS response-associated peptidase YedK